MTKIDLIDKLVSLPDLIEEQEKASISASQQVQKSKGKLTEVEDVLLLGGVIDGKNAEIRAAQMRENTTSERETVQNAERVLTIEQVKINRLNNELAVYKAIAGMLKGAE